MTDTAAAAAPSERDRHLFGPGPKRILALDGGGVRGAITVAFLERIEALLDRRYGKEVRLGDHFDLVGGTSTGAVIAGALALGKRTAEIKKFYLELAPNAFKRQNWPIPVLRSKFDARGLRDQIADVVGNRKLGSEDLITGFALVTKRVDTGSAWVVSNDPRAPYWEDAPGHIGNKHYPLVNLVRASTAAPHFFDPELLAISSDKVLPEEIAQPLEQPWLVRAIVALLARLGLHRGPDFNPDDFGLFVDGGVTPHNNPAVALLELAALKAFGICWPMSPGQLTITSVGTGSFRPKLKYQELGFAGIPKLTLHALISMMNDAQTQALALMQWLGKSPDPWVINSEIGTLADDAPPGGKLFDFQRYDVLLEEDWLSQELERPVRRAEVERYRHMDNPGIVNELYDIGCKIAERQVKPEHWLG
jgi:predicted acylesterase/phospholipase RssA